MPEPDTPLDLNHLRRGEGEPLLLVHSLGGSNGMWSPVLDRLAESFDVVAVDMPGFGDSPSLPEGVAPTAANFARAVLDFHESLGAGRPPHVAGISLGGWVSVECGRQGRAASVTGFCSAGFWPRPLAPKSSAARTAARLVSPFAPHLMKSEAIRKRALASQMRHPERMTPAEAVSIIRGYADGEGYPEANAQMRAHVVGDISDLDVPVTLAWGEFDQLVRRSPLRSLPDSVRQLVLPDCGHIPTWDQPEMVTETILENTAARVA